MKDKQDKFNEDEQLRALAYKSELAKATRMGEQKESYESGFESGFENGFESGENNGICKERYEKVVRYFKRYYSNADISFLEGLTLEKYDLILDMIFDRKPLEDIVAFIKE